MKQQEEEAQKDHVEWQKNMTVRVKDWSMLEIMLRKEELKKMLYAYANAGAHPT